MAKPLIGITTYVEPAVWGHWDAEAALVPYDYVRAVERAGGRAVLVPPDDDGIEEKLELAPAFEGNAYESDVERFPHALREAIARLESSSVARRLLGDDVVDHYLNYARTEQELYDKTVTGYERERMFERG